MSCRQSLDRSQLIRIIKDHKTGELKASLGLSKELRHCFGRSFYICNDPKCIQALTKNKKYKSNLEKIMELINKIDGIDK